MLAFGKEVHYDNFLQLIWMDRPFAQRERLVRKVFLQISQIIWMGRPLAKRTVPHLNIFGPPPCKEERSLFLQMISIIQIARPLVLFLCVFITHIYTGKNGHSENDSDYCLIKTSISGVSSLSSEKAQGGFGLLAIIQKYRD